MTNSIISLNGNTYDAITGTLVSKQTVKKASIKQSLIKDIAPAAPPTTPSQTPVVKHVAKKRRSQSTHLKAHHPQPSKTLARRAVKLPVPLSSKARARVQPALGSASALIRANTSNLTTTSQHVERLHRADDIQPSERISHFVSPLPAQSTQPIVQPLAVHPINEIALSSPSGAQPEPSRSVQQKHFDKVLFTATSHTQPFVKHPRKRLTKFSNRFVATTVAVAAVVIIGGFVLTQNLPQIDTQLASLHAGFSVSLPSYQPAGFAFMSHVVAATGVATLNYHSTTDQRQFTINQQVSNWSNQTLRDYVASTGKQFQTWQDKGRTVYLYGSNLTWVSGGIWYQITNSAELSSTQLLNIATSM